MANQPWLIAGKPLVTAGGVPYFCEDCPCGPTAGCPTTGYCSGTCASTYSAAISGITDTAGCIACDLANTTETITYSSGCVWYASWYDSPASFELLVECTGGEWVATLTVVSPFDDTCDLLNDEWTGSITAYTDSCPTGTFTLTHQSGSNCSGTATVVIS